MRLIQNWLQKSELNYNWSRITDSWNQWLSELGSIIRRWNWFMNNLSKWDWIRSVFRSWNWIRSRFKRCNFLNQSSKSGIESSVIFRDAIDSELNENWSRIIVSWKQWLSESGILIRRWNWFLIDLSKWDWIRSVFRRWNWFKEMVIDSELTAEIRIELKLNSNHCLLKSVTILVSNIKYSYWNEIFL